MGSIVSWLGKNECDYNFLEKNKMDSKKQWRVVRNPKKPKKKHSGQKIKSKDLLLERSRSPKLEEKFVLENGWIVV